jgi:hypothetical protein
MSGKTHPLLGTVPIIGQRRALVRIAPHILQLLCTPSGAAVVCVSGLPQGARLLGLAIDPASGEIGLTFEHPSFPLPSAGSAIPQVQVQFQAVPLQVQQAEPPVEEP